MINSVVQNMMTKIMKELLWRQVWWNMSIARKYSHICHGYNVDQLDPAAIFNYQVDNPPFTVYHFVAHMVVLRNQPCCGSVIDVTDIGYSQHVPKFQQLLIALICGLF